MKGDEGCPYRSRMKCTYKTMLSLLGKRQYITNEASKPKGFQQETLLLQIAAVCIYIYIYITNDIRVANLTIKIKYKIFETNLAISR